MGHDLSADEVRVLRRKCRLATLDALSALGGRSTRGAIRDHVIEHADFTEAESNAPPPPKAAHKHTSRLENELSWTLTNLKRDGLVANPARSVWELAGAAAEPDLPLSVPVLVDRLDQLRAMPYRKYLRSPEWRETRGAALVRAGHACALDISHVDRLEVHHRTYDRLGEERPSDVIVLCQDCHRHHHQHVGRPQRGTADPVSVPPPAIVADLAAPVPAPAEPRPSLLSRLFAR